MQVLAQISQIKKENLAKFEGATGQAYIAIVVSITTLAKCFELYISRNQREKKLLTRYFAGLYPKVTPLVAF